MIPHDSLSILLANALLALITLGANVVPRLIAARNVRRNGHPTPPPAAPVICPHGEGVRVAVADAAAAHTLAKDNREEIDRLRVWRHDSASRFGALELLPNFITQQQTLRGSLEELRANVARIEGRLGHGGAS